jgi:hypothetical protein
MWHNACMERISCLSPPAAARRGSGGEGRKSTHGYSQGGSYFPLHNPKTNLPGAGWVVVPALLPPTPFGGACSPHTARGNPLTSRVVLLMLNVALLAYCPVVL